MRGEQNARLALIEQCGQGVRTLMDADIGVDADSDVIEEKAGLLIDASASLYRMCNGLARDMEREVKAATEEFDPDDRLTEMLWHAMQLIKPVYQALESWMPRYRQRGEYIYSMAVVAKENIARSFDLLKNTRILILEHDADASGICEETFTSVDALISALNSDD